MTLLSVIAKYVQVPPTDIGSNPMQRTPDEALTYVCSVPDMSD